MAKLLIVDDEPDIRTTLRNIAETVDIQIEEAVDGKDGVAKAKKFLPDLIFLDVMMPGLKTKEILELLKADTSTAKIPVVLITVMRFSDKELKAMLETTQIVNYIPKPFEIDSVIDTIKKHT